MTVDQLFGNDGSLVSEANFETVFGGLLEGVLSGIDNECSVVASGPPAMTVEVRTGTFCVGGVFGRVSAQHLLTISAAPGGPNNRIDRVVLRRDNATNLSSLAVVDGTPAVSPVAPALTRAGGIWEDSLAQVRVNNGQVSVTTSDITDERYDRSVCGFATAVGAKAAPYILDRNLTLQSVDNNGADTPVYTKTIPAGACGAIGGLRLSIGGRMLSNGPVGIVLTLRFGGVIVAQTSTGPVVEPTAVAADYHWFLEAVMMNSAANAQKWILHCEFVQVGSGSSGWRWQKTGAAGVPNEYVIIGAGYAASAIDTTLAKDLVLSADWVTADPSNEFHREMAILEVLP